MDKYNKYIIWVLAILLALALVCVGTEVFAGVDFGMTTSSPVDEETLLHMHMTMTLEFMAFYEIDIIRKNILLPVWQDFYTLRKTGHRFIDKRDDLGDWVKDTWEEVFTSLEQGQYVDASEKIKSIQASVSSPLTIPEFKSNLEAELFALKNHAHLGLIDKLWEKRLATLREVKLDPEGKGLEDILVRKGKTSQADYILKVIRTLEREDFNELLEKYASSPVGNVVVSVSRPLTTQELEERYE